MQLAIIISLRHFSRHVIEHYIHIWLIIIFRNIHKYSMFIFYTNFKVILN